MSAPSLPTAFLPPLFRGGISFLSWMLAILLITQVGFRYGLNSSLVRGEEVSRYTMILLVFLGALPLVHANQLSAFSAGGAVGRGFALIGALVRMVFYVAFGISTVLLIQKSGGQRSIALGWPMGVIYAPMLVFAVAAALISLRTIVRSATNRKNET
jgi:TRAP-type transport system small permease protein